MLAVPLVLGAFTLFASFQWLIQDQMWEEQLADISISQTTVIQEVEASECRQPKPAGAVHICAQSTEWWSPTDSTDCGEEVCYVSASLSEFLGVLEEWESSYFPILIPGLLPLIFLFLVIRKVIKARKALEITFDTHRPIYPPR